MAHNDVGETGLKRALNLIWARTTHSFPTYSIHTLGTRTEFSAKKIKIQKKSQLYLTLFRILSYTVYINDLSQASSIFKFIMYADDTTLFSNLAYFGNNIESKESLINAELSNDIEWLNINKLSLNKSKYKYMICHVPNKDIQYITLKIDNVIIEKVDECNFLGLTMDTNLNWKKTFWKKSLINAQKWLAN